MVNQILIYYYVGVMHLFKIKRVIYYFYLDYITLIGGIDVNNIKYIYNNTLYKLATTGNNYLLRNIGTIMITIEN